jgi:hypothetical protein
VYGVAGLRVVRDWMPPVAGEKHAARQEAIDGTIQQDREVVPPDQRLEGDDPNIFDGLCHRPSHRRPFRR